MTNQPAPDCMAFMGQSLPPEIRQFGYKACIEMGLTPAKAHECTEKAANLYERDEPYQAQKSNLTFLDLTGHYRLMATLSAAWWENIGKYGEGQKTTGHRGPEVSSLGAA